jgi:hypothetical protein
MKVLLSALGTMTLPLSVSNVKYLICEWENGKYSVKKSRTCEKNNGCVTNSNINEAKLVNLRMCDKSWNVVFRFQSGKLCQIATIVSSKSIEFSTSHWQITKRINKTCFIKEEINVECFYCEIFHREHPKHLESWQFCTTIWTPERRLIMKSDWVEDRFRKFKVGKQKKKAYTKTVVCIWIKIKEQKYFF